MIYLPLLCRCKFIIWLFILNLCENISFKLAWKYIFVIINVYQSSSFKYIFISIWSISEHLFSWTRRNTSSNLAPIFRQNFARFDFKFKFTVQILYSNADWIDCDVDRYLWILSMIKEENRWHTLGLPTCSQTARR